jgi:hypothetical protein
VIKGLISFVPEGKCHHGYKMQIRKDAVRVGLILNVLFLNAPVYSYVCLCFVRKLRNASKGVG